MRNDILLPATPPLFATLDVQAIVTLHGQHYIVGPSETSTTSSSTADGFR